MKRLRLISVAMFFIATIWSQAANAEVSMRHRIVSTSIVHQGTHINFHLSISNLSGHDYFDLILIPVDPTLTLTPNEITVSLDRIDADEQVKIPWGLIIPYSLEKFPVDIPIVFLGRATDSDGNSHILSVSSSTEEHQ